MKYKSNSQRKASPPKLQKARINLQHNPGFWKHTYVLFYNFVLPQRKYSAFMKVLGVNAYIKK